MYIETIRNRNSQPAILLRRSMRREGKVVKETIANLSDWDEELIENMRRLLKGAKTVFPDDLFQIRRSWPHGHIQAVLGTIRNIGLDEMISSKPCRERNLVLAMIVNQIIRPQSKLACTNNWHVSTLSQQLNLQDSNEDELYAAMDWIYARKERIEKKLAKRHLAEQGHALYDVSSSYYEGKTCKLIRFGYNRDGKKGMKIIVYGVLANQQGCPISIQVYPGNTSDCTTVADQVKKIRSDYGLQKVVMVGDRGMLTQTCIEDLKKHSGIGWISALKYEAVRGLVKSGTLQLSIFDEVNIAEFVSEDYPGERLVACYNHEMADHRSYKREELLKATRQNLDQIKEQVARRRAKKMSEADIGLKVGKVIDKYKMGKHVILKISDGHFEYSINNETIAQEKMLDGIYIVRTSEPARKLSTQEVVKSYKDLSRVEQLFRTLKGVDLQVRPIRHRLDERVIAHFFISLLAYYVEWHMKQALAPLLFVDSELKSLRKERDPVAKAEPSDPARVKKFTRKTEDGLPVLSFRSLLDALSACVKNECCFSSKDATGKFSVTYRTTDLTPLQKKAFELLNVSTQ